MVMILAVNSAVEVTDMTIGAKSAVAAAVLGSFWLGVWTAPLMHNRDTAAPVEQSDVVLAAGKPEPRRAAPKAAPAVTAPAATLAASAEPVRNHVKPLLNWGTDTKKAAAGFDSAEDFMAVAHAARNTEIPFVLLKHRVLNEKQSLAEAIRASKPELDARLEADRATLEARANLSRLGI